MTAKEKAIELRNKMFIPLQDPIELTLINSKYCAIIAVDEIIKEFKNSDSLYATNFLADYWQEVKTELEKL